MTFAEWWEKDGRGNYFNEVDFARAAWNAALDEAVREIENYPPDASYNLAMTLEARKAEFVD